MIIVLIDDADVAVDADIDCDCDALDQQRIEQVPTGERQTVDRSQLEIDIASRVNGGRGNMRKCYRLNNRSVAAVNRIAHKGKCV